MKLLVDMNLSPSWIGRLTQHGFEAVHWSEIGAATAGDDEILSWARVNGFVLLTNDLDFSAILAATFDAGTERRLTAHAGSAVGTRSRGDCDCRKRVRQRP